MSTPTIEIKMYINTQIDDILATSETYLRPDILDGDFLGCDLQCTEEIGIDMWEE